MRCSWLLCLAALSCLLAAAQSPAGGVGTFTIAGMVVDHASNRPLKNAVVTISPTTNRSQSEATVTGDDGTFLFSLLPPGKYSLSARRRGYIPRTFQQHDGFSTAIVVGPGLDSEHIVFPLIVGGSIAVIVTDDEGEPVRQAQIWLFRTGIINGESRTAMHRMGQTDSAGQFHFSHLEPGMYYVAAHGRPWFAQPPFVRNPRMPVAPGQGPQPMPVQPANEDPNAPNLDVVYPLTYYAGTTEAASASPIAVTDAATANVQIVLRAVPAVHVQLEGGAEQPGRGVNAMVQAIGPGGFPMMMNAQQIFGGPNSQPTIEVPPGNYTLMLYEGGRRRTAGGSAAINVSHDTAIDVGSVPKGAVSGRITFEGSAAPDGTRVFLVRTGGPSVALGIQADGTLSVANGNLTSGHYDVRLVNADGFYLKSVAAKGAAASAGGIEVTDGASVQLTLVTARGASPVNGVAERDGKPVPGAMILAIPQDASRTDLIRRDQSDSDGTFTLPDVVPGRYTLIAIDNGEGLAYDDSAAIKPYLAQGKELVAPAVRGALVKVPVLTRVK